MKIALLKKEFLRLWNKVPWNLDIREVVRDEPMKRPQFPFEA